MKYKIKIEKDISKNYPFFASCVICDHVFVENGKTQVEAEKGLIEKLSKMDLTPFETIEKEIEI